MSNTAIDIFCGIGGLSLGALENGFEIIYALDMKSKATKIFKDNFKNCNVVTANAYETDVETIPECDLLLSGPSCQPYSKAGRRMGLEDPRANTFLYVFEYLKRKKPKSFLIENVAALKTMGRRKGSKDLLGPVFTGFLEKFAELGYDVFYNILDSQEFGVPQRRKRLYLVGFLKNLSAIFPFDLGVSKHIPVEKNIGSVLQSKEEIFAYYDDKYAEKFWLSQKAVDGLLERKRKNIELGKGFGFREPLNINSVFPTFVAGGSGRETSVIEAEVLDSYVHVEKTDDPKTFPSNIGYRFPTEIEMRRGMGFPESFKIPYKNKTLCYDVFSNAVTPPVAEYLIELIKAVLEKE